MSIILPPNPRITTPTLSAAVLSPQAMPGTIIGTLSNLTRGTRRVLVADGGGRVALSGSGVTLVAGLTASASGDAAFLVTVRTYLDRAPNNFVDAIFTITVGTYDVATTALLAAFTAAPPTYWTAVYNRTIVALKAAGLWEKLDVFWLGAAHDNQGGRVNWKLPGTYTGTKTGTVDFVAGQGFKGDGSTGYIDTGWNPSSNAVQFTLNSATLGWFVYPDFAAGVPVSFIDGFFDIGCATANVRGVARSGSNISGRLNSANTAAPVVVTASVGLNFMVRRDAASMIATKYGASAGPVTGSLASASTAIGNGALRICGGVAATFSSRRIGCHFAGAAFSDTDMATMATIIETYFRSIGTWATEDVRLPLALSTSSATWGSMSSQAIPAVCKVGTRLFQACYGVTGQPAGTSAEALSFVRLRYSDDNGATYAFGAAVPPQTGESCIDPHITADPYGRLLMQFPYRGNGGKRTILSYILTNPSAALASWVWLGPYFMDYGFVGTAYVDGPEMIYTASEPLLAAAPPYLPWQGNKFARIRFHNGIPVHVAVSTIPNAVPEITLNDFYETSMARRADGSLFAIFRVNAANNYYSVSTDDGATWSGSAPYLAVLNPSQRACLRVDPYTGTPFILHCNHPTQRANMSLTQLSPNCMSAVRTYLLDGRGATLATTTYGDLTFDATSIIAGWDYGRGVQDPPTYSNELMTCVIPRAGMLTNAPTKTTTTVTS